MVWWGKVWVLRLREGEEVMEGCRGKLGRGITFEMYINKITNKK